MAYEPREEIGRLAVSGMVQMPKPIRRKTFRNMVALACGFASIIMVGVLLWAV